MCQIESIDEIAFEDPISLKIEKSCRTIMRKLGVVSIMRGIRRRRNRKMSNRKSNLERVRLPHSHVFDAGRVVRIRSETQILQTLDDDGKLDGCRFMDEMWQYCGSRHKVLKRVKYFFDETSCTLRKTRNTVLLEGLQCSGNILHWRHRCDRSCYYFWKEDWLEMVE